MENTIHIECIEVESRQRKEFLEDRHRELIESIEKIGLLNPIVLERRGEKFFLRAGDRRLRAVKEIYELGGQFAHGSEIVPHGMIPFTLFENLSEIQRLTIEIEENTCRVDFTWQERVRATEMQARLMNLVRAEEGQPPPTVGDIAEHVRGSSYGESQNRTKQELILAKYLDDPVINTAASMKDAYSELKRREISAKNRDLADRIGTTFSASMVTLLNVDSLEWMIRCDSGQFDVILTDPPYGMGADTFGDAGGRNPNVHTYSDDPDTAITCYRSLAINGFRVCKDSAHLYTFVSFDMFPAVRILMQSAGWKVFQTPLIWYKPGAYRAPWPEKGPQRSYECILFAVKGHKKVNIMAPDVIECKSDPQLSVNSAQKPVGLLKELLGRSTHPGDKILDPFCGTGSTVVAGYNLKCYVTAIDFDPVNYGCMVKRVQELS